MELFWTTKLRFKLGVMPYSQHKLTSTEVYLGMKLPYKPLNTEKKILRGYQICNVPTKF